MKRSAFTSKTAFFTPIALFRSNHTVIILDITLCWFIARYIFGINLLVFLVIIIIARYCYCVFFFGLSVFLLVLFCHH
eukprot:UN01231